MKDGEQSPLGSGSKNGPVGLGSGSSLTGQLDWQRW
jgi:hypothetical protein